MELEIATTDTSEKALEIINYILKSNWSVEEKKIRLTRFFNLTGDTFYRKIFSMSSDIFDSNALETLGFSNPDDQIERLSTKLVRDYSLGRDYRVVGEEFYYSVATSAQQEAFNNAYSLDKHPTLRRKANANCCSWCAGLEGFYIDPVGDVFAHHEKCRCSFEIRGFNTRNGKYKGHVPNRYESTK